MSVGTLFSIFFGFLAGLVLNQGIQTESAGLIITAITVVFMGGCVGYLMGESLGER